MKFYIKISLYFFFSLLLTLSFFNCSFFEEEETFNGEFVEDIVIEGVNDSGYIYSITEDGKYRFKIKEGSIQVSPYPDETVGNFGWTTYIIMYKNRSVERSTEGTHDPKNWDYAVGGNKQLLTAEEAAAEGKGKHTDITLKNGDSLIIIVSDGGVCGDSSCYGDNFGSVTLSVYKE